MKIIITLVMIFFITNTNADTIINKQRITIEQAKALVSIVMWHGTKYNPCAIFTPKDLMVSDINIQTSRFVDFMVGCRNTNGDDFYSVDFYTGDVFGSGLKCSEIKNKNLEALQKQIRQSLHLTQTEYKKIKTKGPMCDE